MSVTVRVEGLRRTVRALDRAGAGVDDVRDALGRIAANVEPDYKRYTPRARGRLQGTYRIGKAKSRAVIYVGTRAVPYAGPINYGWRGRNIKPAHFIAKGDVIAAPKASTQLEQELGQLFAQLGLT